MNVLHWGKRERVKFEQQTWRDITTYRVKFSGKFNTTEIRRAMETKLGGYPMSVVDVAQENDEHVMIQVSYSIGD